MENNNKKKGDQDKDGKGPKFNVSWIYGLIAVVLIALNLFPMVSGGNSSEISINKFEEYALENDVNKIEVVNEKTVLVYLAEEALTREEHKDAAKGNFGSKANYNFEIGSIDKFQERLDRIDTQRVKSGNNRLDVKYETHNDVIGPMLGWLLPFVIIIGIWLFIMRRMSGGSGEIYSIRRQDT